MNNKEFLTCDQFFHVYNHAIGKEILFFNDQNYIYFLKLFSDYILPIADLYGYCLMNNHFHFLIKIKSEDEVFKYFWSEGKFPEEKENLTSIKKLSNAEGLNNIDVLSLHISKQFSNYFNAYAKAINEQEKRRGSLFESPFKRKALGDEEDIKQCLVYIHCNAVKHQVVDQIKDWKYSSYVAYLTDKPTKVKREEVLEWFDGTENFISCHIEALEKVYAERANLTG
jgi:REP element-mobilizing transposase RayT